VPGIPTLEPGVDLLVFAAIGIVLYWLGTFFLDWYS
jgi:hypothetical protein